MISVIPSKSRKPLKHQVSLVVFTHPGLPGFQKKSHSERPEVVQSSIKTNDLGTFCGFRWDHGNRMEINIYLCFRVRDAIWGGAGIQDFGFFPAIAAALSGRKTSFS